MHHDRSPRIGPGLIEPTTGLLRLPPRLTEIVPPEPVAAGLAGPAGEAGAAAVTAVCELLVPVPGRDIAAPPNHPQRRCGFTSDVFFALVKILGSSRF